MTRLLVTGRNGRMGQAVLQAASQTPNVEVTATHNQGENISTILSTAGQFDCIIDFTLPSFTSELLSAAKETHTPLVMGTTGHSATLLEEISQAANDIPICHAPNFSVGVNTLFWLTRKATQILGDAFDIEIVEMHHKHKRDAPSGTAVRLAQVAAQAKNLTYPEHAIFGREGEPGPRPQQEIAVHTLRGGDVVGDHTAIFAADGERVELTHKASSRATFAQGSVRAAAWLSQKTAGLYNMENVLGLQ